ncbi:MAG: pilus assembly protein PilM [Planctomycetes bacterium]|nr:pilus assembly protein PilM [Planctomycetota bacterium]
MARTVTGVDIGLRTGKFLRGSYKGNTFHVTDFEVVALNSKEITAGWSACSLGFKPTGARVGLTGRDVNIRYTRVPRVPDWQLKNLMRFEVAEIGDQSGSGVASDFNVLPALPEIEGEDVVLLALARESFLEAHSSGLEQIGGKLDAFSPNAVALYNAFLRFGVVQDEVVLVANIGHDNLDIVITRGPDLLFARNLTGGSRLFEESIAHRMGVSGEKARELKETLVDLDPHARFTDSNAEKSSRAALAGAGQLLSLLQSAILFCKSQVKITGLKLDRVLLCGGGAAIKGLPKYLSAGMSVPVEIFDAFRVVNTDALAPGAKAALEDNKLEAVVALGLATMASDDDAWGIEILPASVRKKREFLGGQLFLIAAGVLALAFLGYHAWRTRDALEDARKQASLLDAQYKKASATHHRAEEMIAENKKLAAFTTELAQLKGSGEQVARGIALLQDHLPANFWVTKLSADYRADPELGLVGNDKRPTLSIEGKAREGTNSLSVLYESFVTSLTAKLPKTARLNQRLTPSGSKFTVDFSLFAPPLPNADAAKEGN